MNAAIIEIGGSHDELLYSQVRILKSAGYGVFLFLSEKLKNPVSNYDDVDGFYFFDFRSNKPPTFREIRKQIKATHPDIVIFNTAHGKMVRNLVLFPWGTSTLIGIAHNIQKLHKSLNQKIISTRIKKYFVLNEYLLENDKTGKRPKIDVFYPLLFPPFNDQQPPKNNDELWVCVPGLIEEKRRDYTGLLRALSQSSLSPKIKFILLGRFARQDERETLTGLIASSGLENQFQLFDHFIPHDEFHSYLRHSDLVMPLLHPQTERFFEYSKIQISGTYNLAFSHKKPMLMENTFAKYPIFKETSFFYTMENLVEQMNDLAANRPLIEERSQRIRDKKTFTFEFQKENYLKFINE